MKAGRLAKIFVQFHLARQLHLSAGVRREGEVVPTTSPPTDLQLLDVELWPHCFENVELDVPQR